MLCYLILKKTLYWKTDLTLTLQKCVLLNVLLISQVQKNLQTYLYVMQNMN
jgi:hypothetical protein